jgi:hypothetical protein
VHQVEVETTLTFVSEELDEVFWVQGFEFNQLLKLNHIDLGVAWNWNVIYPQITDHLESEEHLKEFIQRPFQAELQEDLQKEERIHR